MIKKCLEEHPGVFGVIAVIILVAVILSVSWAIVCFVVWLISLCFGFHYTLLIGTGVWLVIILLRYVVSAAKSDK